MRAHWILSRSASTLNVSQSYDGFGLPNAMYLKNVSPKLIWIGFMFAGPTNHGVHPLAAIPPGPGTAISAPTGHPGNSSAPFRFTPP